MGNFKLGKISENTKLIKEWDFEKNTLSPFEVTCGSTKRAWWKCPNGHSYDMKISDRGSVKQLNCPICSGERVVKGINDLFTTNPELKEKWDFEKNTIDPTTINVGSNRYAYWKCKKGHSYKSMIYCVAFSRKEMNCPICRNFEVITGYNDLATTHPQLLKEWDFEKNKLDPTKIIAGSNKKAWWKCEKYGHSWEAVISSRTRANGNGCPYCSNQKLLVGFNDIGTLYPSIYDEWDYEKNKGKTPKDFKGIYSDKKIWMKCKKGHSYRTQINVYCRGSRCPVCANKQIIVGENDLGTTHPNLLNDWDYEKNVGLSPEQFTYGSDTKVWWICERGHSWQSAISARSNGKKCPQCFKEYQSSLPEKMFAYYLSKNFKIEENVHLPELGKKELDIYIPSLKLAVEYDGYPWHKNTAKDKSKDDLCNKYNINIIHIREDGCPIYESSAYFIKCPRNHGNVLLLKDTLNELIKLINNIYNLKIDMIDSVEDDISYINEMFYSYNKQNSIEAKCPQLLDEWNYEKNGRLNPKLISIGSNARVWWKCSKGHEWSAIVASRAKGNGCPICNGKKVLKGFNDLESIAPHVAKEWDYSKNGSLSPDKVHYHSHLKVWWKCEKGHSWKADIEQRVRMNTGCPTCKGKLPLKGVTDLGTKRPDLNDEWDYKKNYPLTPKEFLPGSEKVVWWICPKGHSYDMQIAMRANQDCKCPICSNKRVLKGYNDLETLHPEIAIDWNYKKNHNLTPDQVSGAGGSHRKVWFKCNKCGYEWETAISTRVHLNAGCPRCAIDRNMAIRKEKNAIKKREKRNRK